LEPGADAVSDTPVEAALSLPTVLMLSSLKARGIHAGDRNGVSDPYLVVTCGGESRRTSVLPKTLTPEWTDETVVFEGPSADGATYVRVDVVDECDGGVLGGCDVPVAQLFGCGGAHREGWTQLFFNGAPAGEVFLRMAVTGPGQEPDRKRAAPTALLLFDLAARGLRAADGSGSSNPYVVMTCGGTSMRTTAVPWCVEPTWGGVFPFRGPAVDEASVVQVCVGLPAVLSLYTPRLSANGTITCAWSRLCLWQVDVFDNDSVGSDLLGSVDVQIANLWGTKGVVHSGWYPLFLNQEPVGELHMAMRVTGAGAMRRRTAAGDETIRPSSELVTEAASESVPEAASDPAVADAASVPKE
jgi:hypothetical protein